MGEVKEKAVIPAKAAKPPRAGTQNHQARDEARVSLARSKQTTLRGAPSLR
jgi:hypothetical protein